MRRLPDALLQATSVVQAQACTRRYLVVYSYEKDPPKSTYSRIDLKRGPLVGSGFDGPLSQELGLILDDGKQSNDAGGLVVLEGRLLLMEDFTLGFLHVSVKMAHTNTQKAALRNENDLRSNCAFIPGAHPMFGLFGDDSEEGQGRLWLIQASAGASLSETGATTTITESQRCEIRV